MPKRATMMVRGLKAKSYEKQLKELFSLKKGKSNGPHDSNLPILKDYQREVVQISFI